MNKRTYAGIGSAAVLLGVGAWGLSGPAMATPGEVHKVWVCKYVQTPGHNEVVKLGKQPIQVDVAATDGTWFKDGQTLSFVITDVTEANTGHPGNYYTGNFVCPDGPPEPTSTTSTSAPAPGEG